MSSANNYYLGSKKPYQYSNSQTPKYQAETGKGYLSSYLSPKNNLSTNADTNHSQEESSSPLSSHKKSYTSQSYDNLPSSSANEYSHKLETADYHKTSTGTHSHHSSSTSSGHNYTSNRYNTNYNHGFTSSKE